MANQNPISLNGIGFIEYASSQPENLRHLFLQFGFEEIGTHKNNKKIYLFKQGHCHFVLNEEKNTFAENFSKVHGPSVCSLGFQTQDPYKAFKYALSKGAKAVESDPLSHSFPAIYGVGNSVIYFLENSQTKETHFYNKFHLKKEVSSHNFLLNIDHLTHNVPQGKMNEICLFYEEVFGFSERKYFDIKGTQTGLISKVMRSPCNTITIPINEPAKGKLGEKSQIQEYLDEYKGSGIQHIAFITKNIISAIQNLRKKNIQFLNIPEAYYDVLKQRVPLIKEEISDLKTNHILADGDDKGYLLQIFTENMIGPIFYEIIQRKGHDGFGEGNFQALFDAMERDQAKRGYL